MSRRAHHFCRATMTAMTLRRLLVTVLLLNQLHVAISFTHETSRWSQTGPSTNARIMMAHLDDEEPPSDTTNHWDRRSVMESLAVGAIALGTATSPTSATVPYNLACLLDLPPVEKGYVRIYLCRHGETENNRLGKVQGARINPPINYTGLQESKRLGTAFDKLQDKCPSLIYHSNLRRAKETAENVAHIIEDDDKTVNLQELSTIGEVDFGSVAENKPLSDARGGMLRTFGSWAAGYVDERGEGGGESGREVMNRVASSLRYLVKEAAENGSGSVIAVSHSKFNRVLLAIMEDRPLIQGATMQQANCCINVLDLKRDGSVMTLGPKSNLLGGELSNAPQDFMLQVPAGKVVRMNEKRHLEDLEFS